MKPSDIGKPTAADIELELNNLKKKILESRRPSEPISSEAIEKLKEDVDLEIANAFISMGLQEKLQSVQLELSKAPDGQANRNLQEKVDKLMQEFKNNLARPGAYLGLKQKLEKLNLVNRLIEVKEKREKLKAEINQRVPNEVKVKMELLKKAQEKLSKGNSLDKELVEEAERAKEELVEVLKSAGLEIVGVIKRNEAAPPPPPPPLQEKMGEVNKEISQEIERVINASGLGGKIEELKSEIAKGSSSEKVKKLEAEIRDQVLAGVDAKTLKEKFENTKLELELDSASENIETKVGAADNGRY